MNNLIKYIPRILFVSSITKALFITPDWPSAVVCLGVTASFLFCEYYSQISIIKDFEKKLIESQQKLTDLETKTSQLSDSVATVKISQGFRPTNNLFNQK